MRTAVVTFLVMLASGGSALGQWLNYPSTGIPRSPDGTPLLSAPAPRTADGRPDLSGVWRIGSAPVNGTNIAAALPEGGVLPWAEALATSRTADLWKDDPVAGCLPLGPRSITGGIGLMAKIIQTPMLIVFLYEDMTYRQIFLDGRRLPADPNPSFMGYSVGRWDGDTLVVETTGFNARSWLDHGGHPHTEALRITERIRRIDAGRLELLITLEDPGAYKAPWTVPNSAGLLPDTDLLEYVCAENERSRARLVGRTEEERRITPAPEILSRYVGTYEVPGRAAGGRDNALFIGRAQVFDITLDGAQLFLEMEGRGKMPLVQTGESTFVARVATVRFEGDAGGKTTRLVWLRPVMGDVIAERRNR